MAQNEFWQGNKAIAMGAIAAGCRFFGGYPITPSTEVMEVMSEELPKLGGKFVQMEDEIGGIAATLLDPRVLLAHGQGFQHGRALPPARPCHG